MRFEYNYILFLEIIPVIIFTISILRLRKSKNILAKKFNIKLLKRYIEINPEKQRFYKSLFIALAIFFIIFSLSRPQIGTKRLLVNQPLKNIYFAVDLSSSMKARDVSPSRIERAKLDILSVINTLQNEKVGLIFFANNAFLQCPATTDYDIVTSIVQSISDETTINNKTNIISPILLAKSIFGKQEENEAFSSLLVILTDGEDNYSGFNKRLKHLKKIPFRVLFTIIGTPFGEPIPEKDEEGNIRYLKNNYGNLILTKIDIQKVKQVIKRTGGGYIVSKNPIYDTKNIKNSYRSLKSKVIKKEFTIERELYQLPLFLSLILIVLYLSIVFKNKDFFEAN